MTDASLTGQIWLCLSNSWAGQLVIPVTTAYAYGTLKSLGASPLWPLTLAAFLGHYAGYATNLALGAGLRRLAMRGPFARRMTGIPLRIRDVAPWLCLAVLLPLGGAPLTVLAGFLQRRWITSLLVLGGAAVYAVWPRG